MTTKTQQTINLSIGGNMSTRRETLNGIEYEVFPVISLVEGVLNRKYYPAEAIKELPDSWNGVPVPVNHPLDSKGRFMDCNQPKVMEEHVIGTVYNSDWIINNQGLTALKHEIYIDINKANSKPEWKDLLERMRSPDVNVEVSTGLWHDNENITGTFNGKEYTSIATAYRPNHLALLPDVEGACSIEDGCGIRVNNENSQQDDSQKIYIVSSKDFNIEQNECKCGGKCGMTEKTEKLTLVDRFNKFLDEVIDKTETPAEETNTNKEQEVMTDKVELKEGEVAINADDAKKLETFKANEEAFNAYLEANKKELEDLKKKVLNLNDAFTTDIVSGMNKEALEAIVKANEAEETPADADDKSDESKDESSENDGDDSNDGDVEGNEKDKDKKKKKDEDEDDSKSMNFKGKNGGTASSKKTKYEKPQIMGNRELFKEIWD